MPSFLSMTMLFEQITTNQICLRYVRCCSSSRTFITCGKYFKYQLCSNRTTTNARHLGVYDKLITLLNQENTAESTTGDFMPSREYQIRWFKDGKAIGEVTTVMSTAEGTAKSVPLTVPNDLTEAAIYTSAVFLQGEDK